MYYCLYFGSRRSLSGTYMFFNKNMIYLVFSLCKQIAAIIYAIPYCFGVMLPFLYINISIYTYLCQLNFTKTNRLSLSRGKMWPPSVLGILPDLSHWCLSYIGALQMSFQLLVFV